MRLLRKILLLINDGVIHLKTKAQKKGAVLISYTTIPFTDPDKISSHTNRWECREIANILLKKGYDVDVIDYNKFKKPEKDYDAIIDIGENLEKYAKNLPESCLKILHITGAHPNFQNRAELERIENIYKRKGKKVKPRRIVEPNKAIEIADVATMLGNEFTKSTYAFANKKIYRIPISTTHTFDFIEKDFNKVKNNYVWLGGSGMAHKGLDLALESFLRLPDYKLYVLGKLDDDFGEAYHKELFETENIKYVGFIDLGSKEFVNIVSDAMGLIYPSCSEGSSGAVVSSMHAGLIPIVSYQSGVNVSENGIILKNNTVAEITKEVKKLSSLDPVELERKSKYIWEYTRSTYNKKTFSSSYRNFINKYL